VNSGRNPEPVPGRRLVNPAPDLNVPLVNHGTMSRESAAHFSPSSLSLNFPPLFGNLFILRPRWWHATQESPHRQRKFHMPLEHQLVRNRVPLAHNVAPSLEQAILAGFSVALTAGELPCERLLPIPMVRRGPPQRRPINPISLRWLDLAADLTRFQRSSTGNPP
jgi:hypothetical protein